LFARGLEARALVDMARSIEAGVGPQHDLAVAGRTCERDAFIDEMAADPQTARRRFHAQQAQLRDSRRTPNEKNRTNVVTVALGDPAALALRIEVLEELRGDLRDQRLERVVPTIFLRIERAVTRDDPADVAGMVIAQPVARGRARRRCQVTRAVKERFDGAHRIDD